MKLFVGKNLCYSDYLRCAIACIILTIRLQGSLVAIYHCQPLVEH
jgi:hypothetical protein